MTDKIAIQLSKDSIVDSRTGEVGTPSEFVENLRTLEAAVGHAEDDVNRLKSELRHARDRHATLVARLRESVRDGRVLPLFEGLEDADHDDEDDEDRDDQDRG